MKRNCYLRAPLRLPKPPGPKPPTQSISWETGKTRSNTQELRRKLFKDLDSFFYIYKDDEEARPVVDFWMGTDVIFPINRVCVTCLAKQPCVNFCRMKMNLGGYIFFGTELFELFSCSIGVVIEEKWWWNTWKRPGWGSTWMSQQVSKRLGSVGFNPKEYPIYK